VGFELFFCLPLEIPHDPKSSPVGKFVRFCFDSLFRISASPFLDRRVRKKQTMASN
jgi:hypothetical protein